MKKWEQQQKQKNHQTQLKNAKSLISKKTTNKTPSSQNRNASSSSQRSNFVSDNHDSQKLDISTVPLYKILKMQNLQQYTRKFVSRGYGLDLSKFNQLSKEELQLLIEEIQCLPRHRAKLYQILEYIKESMPQIQLETSAQVTKLPEIFQPGKNKLSFPKIDSLSNFNQNSNFHQTYVEDNNMILNKKVTPKQKDVSPYTQQISVYNNPKKRITEIPTRKQQINNIEQMKHQKHATQQHGQFNKIQNIGHDFFIDSAEQYDEMQQALTQILKRYEGFTQKPNLDNSKQMKQNLPKSQGKMKEKMNELIEYMEIQQDQLKQKAAIQHKFIQNDSPSQIVTSSQTKTTATQKKENLKTKENMQNKKESQKLPNIHEIKQIQNKICRNLRKQFQDKNPDVLKPDLEYEKLKQLYLSFDSGKLTSTIINLDIEELCFCLASVLYKYIEFGTQQDAKQQQQLGPIAAQKISTHQTKKDSSKIQPILIQEEQTKFQQNQINQRQKFIHYTEEDDDQNNNNDDYNEENDQQDFEASKSQINEILRESIFQDNNNRQHEIGEDIEEIKSENDDEGEIQQNDNQNRILKRKSESHAQSFNPVDLTYSQEESNNLNFGNKIQKKQQDFEQSNFSFVSRYTSIVLDKKTIQTLRSNKIIYDQTFNDKSTDQAIIGLPSKDVLATFCKNIILTCKMEKEVPILALVYIERLLLNSGFGLTGRNWRKITLTSLIMASKIWDDESFENDNFSKAFSQYTTKEINEMERVFLNFIEYKLYIKSGDYAKYYFILRVFASKEKKSFPLQPLDLKTIILLQRNQNKQASRPQIISKKMFIQPLNKSF